jgi:hypothetical protein
LSNFSKILKYFSEKSLGGGSWDEQVYAGGRTERHDEAVGQFLKLYDSPCCTFHAVWATSAKFVLHVGNS